MFCENCQIVFCDKCVSLHSSHEFTPAAEKAKEVRKLVFKYLTKFDELGKSVKRREFIETDSFEARDRISNLLEREMFANTLTETFSTVIQNNAMELFELKPKSAKIERCEKVSSLCERSDRTILETRNLLRISDAVCIQKFLDSEEKIESVLDQPSRSVKTHVCLQWSKSSEDLALNFIKSAVKAIEIPGIQRMNYKNVTLQHCLTSKMTRKEVRLPINSGKHWRFLTNHCENIVIKVTIDSDNVEFMLHNVNLNNEPPTLRKLVMKDILNIFVDEGYRHQLRVHQNDNSLLMASNLEEQWFTWRGVKLRHGWTPLLVYQSNICAWNRTLQQLAETFDGNYFKPIFKNIPDEPKLVQTFRRIVFAHVSKEDTITVKHLKHDTTLRLLKAHHQLSNVDKLEFLPPPEKDAVYLILFDNKERISVKFNLDLSNFLQLDAEIIEVCKYDIPSELGTATKV